MPFKKGQSGNPSGRPPRSRALTEILRQQLNKGIEIDGRKVPAKKLMAQYAVEGLTKGEISFSSGERMVLGVNDYLELLKWTYRHVDGDAKSEIDLNLLFEKYINWDELSDEQLARIRAGESPLSVLISK